MLFSKRTSEELLLIFDVQSSVVCCSLVLTVPGNAPQVVLTEDRSIPCKPDGGSAYLVETALRAIAELIEAVLHFISSQSSAGRKLGPITGVHYVLSSPWAISQSRTLSSAFAGDTEIAKALVMNMLAGERARFMPPADQQVGIIEEKVFDVRLNGYSVAAWEGRKARELEISYVVSIAGTAMVERLAAACAHIARRESVYFHSSLLLQHVGIRHQLPELLSYVLVHIHGELTDIVAVEHHACVFFGSYPMGVRSVVRAIAAGTQTDEQTAESLMRMYAQKNLDEPRLERSISAIQGASAAWVGEFQRLLAQAPMSTALPDKALLSARNHEDFFMDAFAAAYPHARAESLEDQKTAQQISFAPQTAQWPSIGLYIAAIHNINGK